MLPPFDRVTARRVCSSAIAPGISRDPVVMVTWEPPSIPERGPAKRTLPSGAWMSTRAPPEMTLIPFVANRYMRTSVTSANGTYFLFMRLAIWRFSSARGWENQPQ